MSLTVQYWLEMTQQNPATHIPSFVFIDFFLLCPSHLLSFLFRVFKDFQGCQESQGRGAQGWVSPNHWEVSYLSFHRSLLFPLPLFSSPLKSSISITLHLNDALITSDQHYSEITPLAVLWYRRPLSTLITHSVTSLDYGALFTQTLVCFGSGFDQAVFPCCQDPFVKLESKQP